jgi:hypothetical protein
MKRLSLLLSLVLTACGGGGGNTPTVSVQAVTPSTVTLKPECTNPHTDKTYPNEFTGKYNVPTVTDSLSSNVTRSVGLKDYKPTGNVTWSVFQTTNNPCKGDEYTKILYRDSLDKLQQLGVDNVWVYISGVWTVDPTLPYWLQKPENLGYSQELLTYLATEAKKRNIKLSLSWQMNMLDDKGNFLWQLGDSLDKKLWETILASHKKNMIELAKFSETIGVTRIGADWNAMHIGNLHDPTMQEMYVEEIVSTIDEMRKVYTGKITWGQHVQPWHDYRIIDKVDAIHIGVIPKISADKMINFNSETVMVEALKELYRAYQDFHCIYPSQNYCTMSRSGKDIPVIFEVAVQSRDKYFQEGWVEDGFCIKGIANNVKLDCVQTTYVTDFSLQAVGIDGILKAIKSQTYFKVEQVNFHSSYWHTDTLKPSTGYVNTSNGIQEDGEGFPNISQSIRGKPAETVVKQWFKRS